MMVQDAREDALKGLRILVVEDSYLIAWALCRTLGEFGCEVRGPAATVDEALSLLDSQTCDAAILDVNLGQETSAPVARRLETAGTPFLLVSGYASPSIQSFDFPTRRRLAKPVTTNALRAAMLHEFVVRR